MKSLKAGGVLVAIPMGWARPRGRLLWCSRDARTTMGIVAMWLRVMLHPRRLHCCGWEAHTTIAINLKILTESAQLGVASDRRIKSRAEGYGLGWSRGSYFVVGIDGQRPIDLTLIHSPRSGFQLCSGDRGFTVGTLWFVFAHPTVQFIDIESVYHPLPFVDSLALRPLAFEHPESQRFLGHADSLGRISQ